MAHHKGPMSMTYLVRQIVWDSDDLDAQELGLPEAVLMRGDPECFADYLADHFGWCVVSLDAQPLENLPPEQHSAAGLLCLIDGDVVEIDRESPG